MMRVVDPGRWLGESLQLRMDSQDEYDKWKTDLMMNKIRVGELAQVKGNSTILHYLVVDGHQTVVYVNEKENSF